MSLIFGKYCLDITTSRQGSGIARTRLPDHLFNIKFLALARIELVDPNLKLGSKLCKRLDSIEQLAPKQLLRSIR